MVILFYLRKHQKEINFQVDNDINSPSDYSIMVWDIPKMPNLNYLLTLKKLFEDLNFND
jgi:hypothetical protein